MLKAKMVAGCMTRLPENYHHTTVHASGKKSQRSLSLSFALSLPAMVGCPCTACPCHLLSSLLSRCLEPSLIRFKCGRLFLIFCRRGEIIIDYYLLLVFASLLVQLFKTQLRTLLVCQCFDTFGLLSLTLSCPFVLAHPLHPYPGSVAVLILSISFLSTVDQKSPTYFCSADPIRRFWLDRECCTRAVFVPI